MKYIILILLFIIVTNQLFAKKIPGQIISNQDTLQVTLDIPVKAVGGQISFDKLQNKLTVYKKKNVSEVLLPENIDAFQFEYEGELIKFQSVENTLKVGGKFSKKDKVFLRVLREGSLQIYRYYYFSNQPGRTKANQHMDSGERNPLENKYVIHLSGKKLIKVQENSFRKDMTEYFADCPVLVQLIESKEITASHINELINNFTKHCSNE